VSLAFSERLHGRLQQGIDAWKIATNTSEQFMRRKSPFPQLVLSARYENCIEIVSKTESLRQTLLNVTNNDICSISGRHGFQTGSNIGLQNCRKIDQEIGNVVKMELNL